jgi:hypothetical protein
MEPLVDEKQLAEFLCRSVRSIQGDRLKGSGIPYYKVGRSVRYRLSEVEEYLAGCKRRSTSDAGPEGA